MVGIVGSRAVRRCASRTYVLVALVLALMAPLAPANAAVLNGDLTAKYGYTLVIGDSITHQGIWRLHDLRPKWVIDGLGYRTVESTIDVIKYWVRRKGHTPRQLIVALGTNSSGDWMPWHYRKIRPMLPNTKILLVTPIRTASDPEGPEGQQRTERFAAGMQEAAGTQRAVCIADWRALVEADPAVLYDGVHPTTEARKTWARLLATSMWNCS